jgi:FSR family fosmidomycin resistance protein-like MFS transporter
VVGYPASGAFVTLSQATLMDHNPGRQPHMMARWTVFGSVGNLVGPLLLAGGFAMGMGWRWIFFALAGLCLLLVAITWARYSPSHATPEAASQPTMSLKFLLAGVWDGVGNPRLMRWLLLLPFSDLLLDVLTGYLPLYFTDVARLSVAQSSLLLSVLMAAGLVSNIVLIPMLEKFPGRNVVRVSALFSGALYAAWLLLPWPGSA